jgi:prevent-host-death family protein
MKYSESIKPLSYLKAHAKEIIREVSDRNTTMIITQNGEAKLVIQDVKSYEGLNDSLALLKMLAQSTKSKTEGKYKPAKKSFQDLNARIKESD